ncbi:MAG: AAA family ATPase [Bacteroidales bacterium]|nr:AAA family ATPase [Bacteroidales bacterium]
MIIQKIEIRNFRSYYGLNTFDFTNGLTLIIGDNGDGKTTFFEALQWLFNTTVDTAHIENFSEMRKSELEVGESDIVSVSITFDHDGHKVIEKRFPVERYAKDRFRALDQEFLGWEDRQSGREQVAGKILVTRCFDAFLQKFSMFKGESDLNVFNDPNALQQLVAKFSDLREFDKYVAFTEEFENKSYKAYTKESKSDEKISKEVERLDFQMLGVRRDISIAQRELKENESAATLFRGKIEDLERHKDTSEKYTEIKSRIETKRAEAARLKGAISAINFNLSLLDRLWILCAYPPILKELQTKSAAFSKSKRVQNDQFVKELGKREGKLEAINELTQLVNGASRMPWYLPGEAEMEEMIHDHICKVCGREAPEGSEAYRFMVEKLEEHRKHVLAEAEAQKPKEEEKEELFVNSFIEEIHNLSLNLGGYNETEITGKEGEIRDRMELVNTYQKKLSDVEKELAEMDEEKARILIQAEGVSEEMLDKSFHDLKGYFEQRGKAENRATELRGKIEGLEQKRRYIQEQMDALNPGKGQVMVYKKVYEAFERIHNAFVGAKEQNLTLFLTSLEERANEYLSRLNASDFHGIVRLVRTAEDSALIKLYSSNGSEIRRPSGSQQTTMYMSVLFAISDLTTLKREEDYPLIFDAATSSFGNAKEKDFYNIIDTLKKQCIIVTKDFLDKNTLRMDDINKLTCSVYRIQKAEGYNKNDLSTIRTTVVKVK